MGYGLTFCERVFHKHLFVERVLITFRPNKINNLENPRLVGL